MALDNDRIEAEGTLAAAGAPLLSVTGVSLTIGGRAILRDVSLDVGAGEIVTLIGPNGSGKTTLVRIALGLLAPSAGIVRRAPGLAVGYVPQHMGIDDILPLDVRRFLTLTARADERECRAVLAEVGADNLLTRPVEAISGGEMRRVLLARALLSQPALLVLDEPTQAVDVTGQVQLYDLIRRIRDHRGCGILLISHDLHLVMAATDRVVCLNRHVCCSGPPETVTRDPAFLDLFGEGAAGAFAVYTHDHDHTHDPGGAVIGDPEGGKSDG